MNKSSQPPRIPAPKETVILKPSMSLVDQLLGCAHAFGQAVPVREEGEEAAFGTESHAFYAQLATSYFIDGTYATKQRPKAKMPAEERAATGFMAFVRWWSGAGGGASKEVVMDVGVERSFAVDVKHMSAYAIAPPDPKTHAYQPLPSFVVPGTLDFFALTKDADDSLSLYIFDYKTGKDTPSPAASGQLMTQALALQRLTLAAGSPIQRVTIGFVHAPEEGEPAVLIEEVEPDDLIRFAKVLQRALKRIGNGYLRPWRPESNRANWCTYCAARSLCPVSARDLVVDAADALGSSIVKRGGQIVNATAADKIIPREELGRIIRQRTAIDALNRQLGPMIQADILANGPAYYDGKVYTVEETAEFDSISITGINKALGPVKGPKEIERLRKLGCVDKRTSKRIQGRNA